VIALPRFVVLAHDWPEPHFDLMLEDGPVLLTWRLTDPPVVGRAIPAERIANHRICYLTYEGPVSGGRGSVRRVDGGTYVRTSPSDIHCEGESYRGIARWDAGRGEWRFSEI
jgi:hypothetical protein